MDELYGRDMDAGGDRQEPTADATSQTDRPSHPVDENGQENWTEDAEPLTRGEYADQMRQGPAVEETESASDGHHDGTHLQAIEEENQTREQLPEPRTRQEIAEETDHGESADLHNDQAADLDGQIAEQDKLPEPRSRQEIADETRSGADPPTRGESQGDQSYLHVTVVEADTADRTLGDTTPTGIGLKPTGEQLREMENEELSKPEKLRRKLLEGVDDINDAARDNASLGQDLLTRHQPPIGHAMTEVPHPLPAAPPDGGAAPDITSAGLVAGVLLVEATRLSREPLHRIAEAAKGHWPWR